jgi:hypothetical protein
LTFARKKVEAAFRRFNVKRDAIKKRGDAASTFLFVAAIRFRPFDDFRINIRRDGDRFEIGVMGHNAADCF